MLGQFLRNCKSGYDEYIPVLLKYLLGRVAETEKGVLDGVSTPHFFILSDGVDFAPICKFHL